MCMTIVVNILGGPGAGKTTAAWKIAAELKTQGYVTEYVPEFAKEKVWEGNTDVLDGTYNNQLKLYQEQKRRIDRLYGKVDFIVTDSPIILSAVYLSEPDIGLRNSFQRRVFFDFNDYRNFNLFIDRGDTQYETAGRVQNYEESLSIDRRIKSYLSERKIFCPDYKREDIDKIIDNIITTYERKKEQNAYIRLQLNQFTRQKFYISSDYKNNKTWVNYRMDCKEAQSYCILLNGLLETFLVYLYENGVEDKTLDDFTLSQTDLSNTIFNLKYYFGSKFVNDCFKEVKDKVLDNLI